MLIKSFESLLKAYNYSIMSQFGTSAFNTVVELSVRWGGKWVHLIQF